MKVSFHRRFGGPEVLEWIERPEPTPGPGQILVRVRATTVSAADWRALTNTFPGGVRLVAGARFGYFTPRHTVLGNDFAGVVTALGPGTTRFDVGDAVVGQTGLRFGTHAEYVLVPEARGLAKKPENLSFEEAASLPFGGVTSLSFLAAAKLAPGAEVLVNGATGAVGSAAVQISKHLGARVTAVCRTEHTELAKTLGADEVVDYTRDDFAKVGRSWEVILDTAGTATYGRVKSVLRPNGRLLLVNGTLADGLRAPWVAMTSDKRIVVAGAAPVEDPMEQLVRLADRGALRPTVGRVLAFAQIADAYREVASGHKLGSTVLSVG
ncbi:NAD(P)-dependent alcohol dehydrogenase [Stigmatella aurantiaca]|uniref:Alcohol dehydrogenase, zinc containing n=1 Tax=Stigmatella aurantiaca (strain DW4/3-1) TaxID=378806 RepID=Q08XK9_STIAD|nr:NAD(P)-dependent alcohol dehydrogenase [Stigmatella aurantiaca]ADO70536.1 Alcohol dehydrogenase, zinc containing protein [Stigmatella aurantiaca DW4/3-1]EAU65216.1 alcohol dehydrogenase, zinc containing [Stigmatella aurantiaca DW4/3-1]